MSLATIKSRHASAIRTLGFALSLNDAGAWVRAAKIWQMRLSTLERASLALSSLSTLHEADVSIIANAMVPVRERQPLAPMFGVMDEAGFWADMAWDDELKAYALASFNRMTGKDQKAFLRHVQNKVAA